jgi:hypothetical protein
MTDHIGARRLTPAHISELHRIANPLAQAGDDCHPTEIGLTRAAAALAVAKVVVANCPGPTDGSRGRSQGRPAWTAI